jgi:Mn2+/Fe2+ NRAMP family transporter
MLIVLAAGWIVTVIGGYALRWTWTGDYRNTLWDWLQMLLGPLVFPTILLPLLLTMGLGPCRAMRGSLSLAMS